MNEFCSEHTRQVERMAKVTQRLDDLPERISVAVETAVVKQMKAKGNGNGNGKTSIKWRAGPLSVEGHGAEISKAIATGMTRLTIIGGLAYLILKVHGKLP